MADPWWYSAGRPLPAALRLVRRVAVAVVGTTLVLIGAALLVLPGPGLVVIPLGIGLLALEFRWARRLLARVRRFYGDAAKPPSAAPRDAPGDAGKGVLP